jgi:hypothetical protein
MDNQLKLGQSQIQATQADTQYKAQKAGMLQKQLDLDAKRTEYGRQSMLIREFVEGDSPTKKALQAKYPDVLGNMPTDETDIKRVIGAKLAQVAQDPDIGAEIVANEIGSMIKSGKMDDAREMMEYMKDPAYQSKQNKLKGAVSAILRKAGNTGTATTKPVGQPVADASGAVSQDQLSDSGTASEGFDESGYKSAVKLKDPSTFDTSTFENSPFDRSVIQKATQMWFDATREEKGDKLSNGINKFVYGTPTKLRRTGTPEQINIGNEFLKQALNSPDPKSVAAGFMQSEYYKKLNQQQKDRLAQIVLMATTPTK